MTDGHITAVLNRLLQVVNRTLPMYFSDVPPYIARGDESAIETLRQIVAEQQSLCRRINDLILEKRSRVDMGEFPMEFTGLNDCSLEYLLGRMIEYQRRDIKTIEQCVEQLHQDPRAKALAEETLGVFRGHLESLEELQRKPGAAALPFPEPASSP